MKQIGFDKQFTLLAQEAHLTKNMILSGFDLLLKANFFQDKDGYFYSSFFNISIGMERLLKLAVVTHYMLTNNYSTPTIVQLKNKFGHDVKTLYDECVRLMPEYHPLSTKQADDDYSSLRGFFLFLTCRQGRYQAAQEMVRYFPWLELARMKAPIIL